MIKKLQKIFIILLAITITQNVYAEEIPTEEQNESQEIIEQSTNTSSSLYVNETTGFEVYIFDEADLLTDDEEKMLLDDMVPLTEYGNIAFQSLSTNSESTSSYSRSRYHSLFGTESGTLFVIDMYNRNIYIFSDGFNNNYITTSKANIITDNTYRYATNQNYYQCAKESFAQINTILSGGKIAEPMRHISNMILSIIVAFFINFMIVLSASKIKKASNEKVLSNCDISFSISNVVSRKTGTHRVYSPVSESSGGGSSGGGGGGGGGGSSGSGGGHGF